jgi:hypothetical protein
MLAICTVLMFTGTPFLLLSGDLPPLWCFLGWVACLLLGCWSVAWFLVYFLVARLLLGFWLLVCCLLAWFCNCPIPCKLLVPLSSLNCWLASCFPYFWLVAGYPLSVSNPLWLILLLCLTGTTWLVMYSVPEIVDPFA